MANWWCHPNYDTWNAIWELKKYVNNASKSICPCRLDLQLKHFENKFRNIKSYATLQLGILSSGWKSWGELEQYLQFHNEYLVKVSVLVCPFSHEGHPWSR